MCLSQTGLPDDGFFCDAVLPVLIQTDYGIGLIQIHERGNVDKRDLDLRPVFTDKNREKLIKCSACDFQDKTPFLVIINITMIFVIIHYENQVQQFTLSEKVFRKKLNKGGLTVNCI